MDKRSPGARVFKELLDVSQGASWSDSAVPLQARGVSLLWLTRFVRELKDDINGGQHLSRGALMGFGDESVHDAPQYSFLTTHSLVKQIIHPLTKDLEVPLYALVPEQHRRVPDAFVSHTWNSLLVGPDLQRIGSLDALEALGDKSVWIDFVCYNQHTFQSVTNDMRGVIQAVGSLVVCSTPTPIYSRSWCLWELFCAMSTGVPVELVVCPGYRNDKILSVNALYRSFTGIADARSSSAPDQQAIYEAFLAHYGSVERANMEVESLIREKFSGRWHELQPGGGPLEFSPVPWTYDPNADTRRWTTPFFLPGMLDSEDFRSGRTIREVFADAGVNLAEEDRMILAKGQVKRVWEKKEVAYQDFLKALLLTGDLDTVRAGIRAGIDVTEALIPGSPTPFGMAVSQGLTDIVRLLIASGVDVNASAGCGLTALSLAIDKGHTEIAEMLLASGVDVDAEESDGRTALVWAAEQGNEGMVKALLDRGANVNHVVRSSGATALHLAVQKERGKVVALLIERGSRVGLKTASGNTPLHFAAHAGNAEIVTMLLEHGADPGEGNRNGKTARDVARERGFAELGRLMA